MQINKKKKNKTNLMLPLPLGFHSDARLYAAFSGHSTSDLSLLSPVLHTIFSNMLSLPGDQLKPHTDEHPWSLLSLLYTVQSRHSSASTARTRIFVCLFTDAAASE